MKIGILTYHRSYNYGAYMQCYSLSVRMQKDFPDCQVEVIDYISKEAYLNYHSSFGNLLSLIANADTSAKRKRYVKSLIAYILSLIKEHRVNDVNTEHFDEAIKKLSCSEKYIISDNLGEISKYINDNYDIVIVGSDAVWNFQMRPFPNVYFLGESIKTKKLSYAASSYEQPYKILSEKQISQIRKSWLTFDYIGVRDISTENFVKFIDASFVPKHNCDPTVLLDMDALEPYKESVYNKLLNAGFDPNKKSIGLMVRPWLAAKLRQQLGNEYQLVSVFKYTPYADINLMDINPFEWAVCFSFFNATITHYFHGNLLSLKNNTPTLVIEKKTAYNQQYNSKIRDFMNRVNMLENCYFDDEFDYSSLRRRLDVLFTTDKSTIESEMRREASFYNSFKTALETVISNI